LALSLSLLLSTPCSSQSDNPVSSPSASAPSAATSSAQGTSQEILVAERIITKVAFEADGTGTVDTTVALRIHSAAAVQQFAVLKFSYTSYNQSVEVDYVRVRKPDDTVTVTPEYSIQDMPADVTRLAPMYSDVMKNMSLSRRSGSAMCLNTT